MSQVFIFFPFIGRLQVFHSIFEILSCSCFGDGLKFPQDSLLRRNKSITAFFKPPFPSLFPVKITDINLAISSEKYKRGLYFVFMGFFFGWEFSLESLGSRLSCLQYFQINVVCQANSCRKEKITLRAKMDKHQSEQNSSFHG